MDLKSSRRNLAAELARTLVVFGLEVVLIDSLDLKAHLGAYSHVVPYQEVGKFFSVDQDDTFWTLRQIVLGAFGEARSRDENALGCACRIDRSSEVSEVAFAY